MTRADEPFDPVHKPRHYNVHPAGFECIELARHLNFCLGNALKYIFRAGQKDGEHETQELGKAAWYLRDELRHGVVSPPAAGNAHALFDRLLSHYSDHLREALNGLRQAAFATHLTWRRSLLEQAIAHLEREIAERKKP